MTQRVYNYMQIYSTAFLDSTALTKKLHMLLAWVKNRIFPNPAMKSLHNFFDLS